MRLLSFVVAIVGLIGAPVFAADMPVKAPPPPPPVYNWSGFYIGGFVGGGWNHQSLTEDASGTVSSLVGFNDGTINASGLLGGGQIGVNLQSGWFVGGIEFDVSGANITGSNALGTCYTEFPPPTLQGCGTKISALATVTGRVGAVFLNTALFYVVGGGAWAQEKLDNPCNDCGTGGIPSNSFSSADRTGWTIGVGVEYAFASNWSAFLQYNYIDLGTKDLKFTSTSGAPSFTENVRDTLNVLKVGINYKFNFD